MEWRRNLERIDNEGKAKLERTAWFKENAKIKMESKLSKFQHQPPAKKSRKRGKGGGNKAIKLVMLVP